MLNHRKERGASTCPITGCSVFTARGAFCRLGEHIGKEGAHRKRCTPHSADKNGDWSISLSELLRVIQFFNAGGYHCATCSEDGYAPGKGAVNCAPHDSDYNNVQIINGYPDMRSYQDFVINLSELLRLIQLFNTGSYYRAVGEETEDGFAPGSPVGVQEPPVYIDLNGDAELTLFECGVAWEDPGATAVDACGIDLDQAIIRTDESLEDAFDEEEPQEGSYVYQYTVDGVSVMRNITVLPGIPSLSLLENRVILHECDAAFEDPGYVALDACGIDASTQVQVIGTVDVETAGAYPLSYTLDHAGHAPITLERLVIVLPCGRVSRPAHFFGRRSPTPYPCKAWRGYALVMEHSCIQGEESGGCITDCIVAKPFKSIGHEAWAGREVPDRVKCPAPRAAAWGARANM